jgi:hypothetical protein
LDLVLTKPQFKFVTSSSRFPAFVGGYGSGKTEAGITRTLSYKLKYPFLNVAYYLPTYDLINLIAFPRIEEILNRLKLEYRANKNDKVISISGCASIILRTMDRPEKIVGYEVADSVIDELDTMPQDKAYDVWRKIVARNRQKKPDGDKNTVGVCTTPEGFRFVYEKWKKDPFDGSELIRASTYSNELNLPEGYIDSIKNTYPDAMLQAYLNGEFVNLAHGCVYPDFDRQLNGCDSIYSAGEPVHIGMDFNVGKMSASVHVSRDGDPHAVDEFHGYLDTPHIIAAIVEKYWSKERSCSIFIYPDASGGNRKSSNASESDIALLRQAGFTVLANKRNPFVRDRIAAMNKMIFCNGVRRYKVNVDKCPHLVETLEKQAYDKNNEPDKSSGFDHMGDASGYYISYTFPIAQSAGTEFKLTGI